MDVVWELSSQWQPPASVSATASCTYFTALGLQYADCHVVRVRRANCAGTEQQELELQGHLERIECLSFHQLPESIAVLLCSASADCVLVWSMSTHGAWDVSKRLIVDSPATPPSSVTFDASGALVAIACGSIVEVRLVQSGELFVTLEGHLARVTSVVFHPLRPPVLFSASEDRTFKMWDLADKALLYQSAVLSACPITAMALNPVTGDAVFGFTDGSIRAFTVDKAFCRERTRFSVESFLMKAMPSRSVNKREDTVASRQVISSLPAWARQSITSLSSLTTLSSDDPDVHTTDIACSILGMGFICTHVSSSKENVEDPHTKRFNAHPETELVDQEHYLLVGVPSCLVAINVLSWEAFLLTDFQEPTPVGLVRVASSFCFHKPHEHSRMLLCGISGAFLPCFTTICVTPSSTVSSNNQVSNIDNTERLHDRQQLMSSNATCTSVIPQGPPPKGSVLLLPPLSASRAAATTTSKTTKKGLDKPVTFHTRVKSSGYGAAAPFAAKKKTIQDRKTPPKRSPSRDQQHGASPRLDTFLKEYPIDCGLLQHYQQQHALPPRTLHQGAIHHIEFSHDAKWLATGGSDNVAQVCKLPFSRSLGEGNVFAGHDGAVRAIHWSHSNRMVLTTSTDKTVRLWLSDVDTASLTFQSTPPKSATATASSAKKALHPDMVDALFFYMDKFVLSACGNAIRLHQFEIDELFARNMTKKVRRNDVLVDEDKSRKKKVAQWTFDGMHALTALTCVNGSFLSHVVVAAGSDRSVRLVDAAVGKTVRVISDAHARAALSVALPRASCYTSHPANFYDLLLSAAPNNTIHLWDIRADNCVMRFSEHLNRVHRVGVAFSPCMRYVTTGSEDRCAYTYDIRIGRSLTKLSGHTDVVTTVAYNPLHPQLATASYDGSVRFFSGNE
ncbi:TPA: hypothetical protein N0F65_002899 [Lagenidium giganteum]|uniref:Uncharacterized protein n=1 Tax=Lagenidium giganteum TaxID=4803 RepID=A0AAV2Z7Y5_9STRA|nr:TPA: hypothetical protein N0F65_002899 [Lagenidium giganteum]